MKTIISDAEDIARRAAGHVRAVLERKKSAVLALSADEDLKGLYSELAQLCESGEADFSGARIFAVGEREDGACRAALKDELLGKINIAPQNVFFPDIAAPEEYERQIAAAGGIDLAVLGLGLNGRIGFNEPATQFDSVTHVQRLTDATKRELGIGPGETFRAATMGIKTLCSADEIILLALGERRAEALFRTLYARTDSLVPSAFLQIPLNVSVYADSAAAEKL